MQQSCSFRIRSRTCILRPLHHRVEVSGELLVGEVGSDVHDDHVLVAPSHRIDVGLRHDHRSPHRLLYVSPSHCMCGFVQEHHGDETLDSSRRLPPRWTSRGMSNVRSRTRATTVNRTFANARFHFGMCANKFVACVYFQLFANCLFANKYCLHIFGIR